MAAAQTMAPAQTTAPGAQPTVPGAEWSNMGEGPPLSEEEEAQRRQKIMEDLEREDFETFRQIVPSGPRDPPPPYSARGSMLPCVIPQATTSLKGSFMCPFVRAYPPELQARGIDEATFLKFLDGFNEAFVTNPAFEASHYAGMIMAQFYSVQPVQIAGHGLMAASLLGGAAVSYLRARAFVKAHNEKLFRPLGLNCNVLTTKKLIEHVKYPHEKLQLLPMYHSQAEEIGETPQVTGPGHKVLGRRLQALDGYIQPLNLDVPPSLPSENYFKRLGEWQANRRLQKQQAKLDKRRAKGNRKVAKAEHKGAKKQAKVDYKVGILEDRLQSISVSRGNQLASQSAQANPQIQNKIEADYRKEAAKLERKIDKKNAKLDRKLGKRDRKVDRKKGKVDKKEHRAANKVRWIVIYEWNPETSRDVDDSSIGSGSDSASDSDSDSDESAFEK